MTRERERERERHFLQVHLSAKLSCNQRMRTHNLTVTVTILLYERMVLAELTAQIERFNGSFNLKLFISSSRVENSSVLLYNFENVGSETCGQYNTAANNLSSPGQARACSRRS
jgi:hypothetical protein